jgi:hypothetical protein
VIHRLLRSPLVTGGPAESSRSEYRRGEGPATVPVRGFVVQCLEQCRIGSCRIVSPPSTSPAPDTTLPPPSRIVSPTQHQRGTRHHAPHAHHRPESSHRRMRRFGTHRPNATTTTRNAVQQWPGTSPPTHHFEPPPLRTTTNYQPPPTTNQLPTTTNYQPPPTTNYQPPPTPLRPPARRSSPIRSHLRRFGTHPAVLGRHRIVSPGDRRPTPTPARSSETFRHVSRSASRRSGTSHLTPRRELRSSQHSRTTVAALSRLSRSTFWALSQPISMVIS